MPSMPGLTTSPRTADIEPLLAAEDWTTARRSILAALRDLPSDHWLLSRLALTYYEQRRYAKALEIEARALQASPRCPLVLWGYAGTLEMLGRDSEAATIYRRLIRRGVAALARGECGEGLRSARGLVADCWYRLARIHEERGRWQRARAAYVRHMEARRGGASLYDAREVRARMNALDQLRSPLRSAMPVQAGAPTGASIRQ